jgi:Right handed beta helix region
MMTFWLKRWGVLSMLGCLLPSIAVCFAFQTSAQNVRSSLRVTVNSNQDGPIQADSGLTLREAIALTNGDLSVDRLSAQELAQVQTAPQPEIVFNLPTGSTTIRLKEGLPPLRTVGLSLNGKSQPHYGQSALPPKPVVAITPAPGITILRGLTVLADRVAVRGLSLYGFTQANLKRPALASLLPADILITRQLPEQMQANDHQDPPVQGVILEDDWIGISPGVEVPTTPSDFGVSIFNGADVLIRNNYIAKHGGSGIITGINAQGTIIHGNRLERNGQTGMADAIRLEGKIGGTQIIANQIRESGGSAIYLFRPEGSITIQGNQLSENGCRVQQAAMLLMGSGHQVIENEITSQSGPGVVVAAYPQSDRIFFKGNRFSHLKGLSIDLLSREHTEVANYLIGDGPNPSRDTENRRRDTGNGSVNTPEFLSTVFYLIGDRVNLDGKADPGATVVIYKVTESGEEYGPLNQPLATAQANEKGRFGITLGGLKGGDRLSAIATHSDYGTSEPALNAEVRSLH